MPLDAEFAPGTVLADRFELVRELGRGGMGVVFEAVHRKTGRRLAIKFLLPGVASDPEVVARFVREARAAAAIGDRHIVDVVDLGTTPSGALYVVLEYLDGCELSVAIATSGAMSVGRAVHIAYQLARAMGRAHARGIVHRDLKPANVFLVRDGDDPDYVKVLDFGIAKLQPQTPSLDTVTNLTRTGQIVGTPLYMPPEQLRNSRDVDARADVYAMGVILYELLTGQLPHSADTMPELFLRIMTQDAAPLASLRPDIPVELSSLVGRATAREPGHRPRDGDALADELAPWASSGRAQPSARAGHVARIDAPASAAPPRPISTPAAVAATAYATSPDGTDSPPGVSPLGVSTTRGVSLNPPADRPPTHRGFTLALVAAAVIALPASVFVAARALRPQSPTAAPRLSTVAPLAGTPPAQAPSSAPLPPPPHGLRAAEPGRALETAPDAGPPPPVRTPRRPRNVGRPVVAPPAVTPPAGAHIEVNQ